jgi:predicted CXXCH cytochrome family protein
LKGIKKLLILLMLVTAFSLISVSIALAAASGGKYAVPGNAGYEIPHGGYSTSTDACLQCHDIHESAGDYVLMRWATVTDVCGSCHTVYQKKPGELPGYGNRSPASDRGKYGLTMPDANSAPTYDPGFLGSEVYTKWNGTAENLRTPGTGSPYEVYEIKYDGSDSLGGPKGHEGHRLSLGAGQFAFANGVTSTADYIPGGSNTVNAIKPADYDNTVSTMNFTATNGLFCASCHTPHGNFGQMLVGPDNTPGDLSDNPTVITKLLSAKPNHGKARLFVKEWLSGGGKWCAACHDRRLPGAVYHNHPDSACLSCHGNWVGGSTYSLDKNDFPHTSQAPYLLTNEPDALCITCHVPGTLP